jgi:ABC-type branched-subunit amino acid transport system substrate-binding protein
LFHVLKKLIGGMKMKKWNLAKILATVLALVMLFTLTACGGGGKAKDTPAPPQKPTEAPPAQETPEETPEEELKTDTLKIGALLHQTGWFATVDMNNYYEFNAMVAYINEELGGWKVGDTVYKLEAVHADGQSDPEALRNAAISLVDAGVKFTVVTNDFWVIACQDVFEEAGVLQSCAYPVYVPGYFSPDNPMTFTASNGVVGDYAAAFPFIAEYYPQVKTVIFCNDDNGTNETIFNMMRDIAAQYDIEVLENYIMYAGDTTDFSSVALQIVQSGADCFMGNGSPDAYGAILKEVRALGSDQVCACIQGKPAKVLMEYAGPDACYNAFTVAASTAEVDRVMNNDVFNGVVDKVREMYGAETTASFDGAACNNLYVILQAIQKAGSIDAEVVAKTWENMGTVETIYGTGKLGGEKTYGIANHVVAHPKPISVIDPEAEGGWYFWGWVPVEIP